MRSVAAGLLVTALQMQGICIWKGCRASEQLSAFQLHDCDSFVQFLVVTTYDSPFWCPLTSNPMHSTILGVFAFVGYGG